jgi:hypothetical protein
MTVSDVNDVSPSRRRRISRCASLSHTTNARLPERARTFRTSLPSWAAPPTPRTRTAGLALRAGPGHRAHSTCSVRPGESTGAARSRQGRNDERTSAATSGGMVGAHRKIRERHLGAARGARDHRGAWTMTLRRPSSSDRPCPVVRTVSVWPCRFSQPGQAVQGQHRGGWTGLCGPPEAYPDWSHLTRRFLIIGSENFTVALEFLRKHRVSNAG